MKQRQPTEKKRNEDRLERLIFDFFGLNFYRSSLQYDSQYDDNIQSNIMQGFFYFSFICKEDNIFYH